MNSMPIHETGDTYEGPWDVAWAHEVKTAWAMAQAEEIAPEQSQSHAEIFANTFFAWDSALDKLSEPHRAGGNSAPELLAEVARLREATERAYLDHYPRAYLGFTRQHPTWCECRNGGTHWGLSVGWVARDIARDFASEVSPNVSFELMPGRDYGESIDSSGSLEVVVSSLASEEIDYFHINSEVVWTAHGLDASEVIEQLECAAAAWMRAAQFIQAVSDYGLNSKEAVAAGTREMELS